MPNRSSESSRESPLLSAIGNRRVAHVRRGWGRSPLVWAVALLGSASVWLSIMAHHAPHFGADVVISQFLQATDFGPFGPPMNLLNRIGFPPLAAIVYGAVVAVIFLTGRR